MQNKMFISHSSAKKNYLEKLLEIIGHNDVIVDKYTFESGNELWDEIRAAIGQCDIFVYLISKESLTSEWCKNEVGYVRDFIDEGQIEFVPFIIDEDVKIDDPGIKKWIRDRYLTDTFVQPKLLAYLLKRKLRNNKFSKLPLQNKLNHLFIGRELEMKSLTEAYFNENDYIKSTIITSGLPHVGRKRFLREFLSTKVVPGMNQLDPIEIRLDKLTNDGPFDFISQINDIVDLYTYDDILLAAKEKTTIVKTAVQLLNYLLDFKEYIIISDNGVIVHPTGMLSEWFIDIIRSKDLRKALHFSVASRYTPRPDLSDIFGDIVTSRVSALTPIEMKTFVNAYSTILNIEIDDGDTNYLVGELSGFPGQAIRALNILKESNMAVLRRNIATVKSLYEKDYIPIIDELMKDEKAFQILLVVSHFEFISCDCLCMVCGEDITKYIELFYNYSLIESFGTGHKYICLNTAFVDFIRRNKRFKLSDTYKKAIRSVTSQLINETDDRITDISYRLYAAKELLRTNSSQVDEHYLIPSLVLKVIAEEYNAKHDDTVIALADKVLSGYNAKSYEEITRSLTYWLCCSLCRKRDSRFTQEVRYFEDSLYAYNFLYGFYYRHLKRYDKACDYYETALSQPSSDFDDNYRSKAEHEMVIASLAVADYERAFELAERSYKHNPHNSYHIEAYYRCLVRSHTPDISMLKELMDAMHHSYDPHHQVMFETMQAEFLAYVEGLVPEAKKQLIDLIENPSNAYKLYPLRSLKELCGHEDKQTYQSVIKCLKIAEVENDFDVKEDIEI